jgi:hypothetical protein
MSNIFTVHLNNVKMFKRLLSDGWVKYGKKKTERTAVFTGIMFILTSIKMCNQFIYYGNNI